MGALVEIQRKGDSMLEGIRRQREVLEQLERKAEQAERRRAEAELLATEMEEKMHSLEKDVLGLKREKDALVLELEEDESHMTRLGMQELSHNYLLKYMLSQHFNSLANTRVVEANCTLLC